MSRAWKIVVNAAGFDVVWLACIMGAARGVWWAGVLAGAANVAAQVWMLPRAQRRRDLTFMLVAGAAGTCADVVLVIVGVLEYRGGALSSLGVSLPFLAVFYTLWVSFCTTVRPSFSWAWSRPWIGAVIGGLGGPLSYWSGSKLGAVGFPRGDAVALAVVAIQYAVLTPLLFIVARRVLGAGAEVGVATG